MLATELYYPFTKESLRLAITIDGHDEAAIDTAINQLLASTSKAPKALIAKTIKGKGVPFMENNNIWHYTRLDPETYVLALSAVAGSES